MNRTLENTWEHAAWSQGAHIIGIDEAGRGSIAGPLVVAGIILPPWYENPEIYDSKKCTERKREELYSLLLEEAEAFQILVVSEKQIDDLNVYRATQKAMTEIAEALEAPMVITDAMPLPASNKDIHDLIKGDQKSTSVAAASILAKVARDRIMVALDRQYPGYGFAKHKGYPTAEHLAALKELGVLPIHRKSYAPVAMQRQLRLDLEKD